MTQKKTENKVLFYLMSFTWGIMWTIIGLLTFLVAYLFFHKEIDIIIVKGRIAVIFKERTLGV